MPKKLLSILLALSLVFSFVSCVDLDEDIASSSSYQIESVWDTTSTESVVSYEEPSSEETYSSSKISSDISSQNSVGNNSPAVNLSSIPAFSGKPYAIVNNNIPSFSSAELTTVGYEKYSSLDRLGRTRFAIASVGLETMPKANEERGNISSVYPTGWEQAQYSCISGTWLYNRCHLIGWQLSAENANKCNLLTGTKYLNINGMLPFENMVADYIKETGNHVAYRITPIYNGNDLLASGVQMEAFSVEDNGDGICFNVYCYNVQPEITIDYATGKSRGPSNNAPTPTPSSSSPASSSQPTVSTNQDTTMVWIPSSGSKYHSYSGCSNMKNPSQVTRQQAENQGYEACKRCW